MQIQIQQNSLKKLVAYVAVLISVFITAILVNIWVEPPSVNACTPTLGVAEIKIFCTIRPDFSQQGCLNGFCSYEITNDHIEIRVGELSEEEYTSLTEFSQTLGQICYEDTSYLENNLIAEIKSVRDRRGIFSLAQIEFLPNNSENLKQLESEYNKYNVCNYREYRQVDNWLITEDAVRDYCKIGSCGVPEQRRPVAYLQFLVSNPSPRSFYYFLSYSLYSLPVFLFSGMILYVLVKRGFKKLSE